MKNKAKPACRQGRKLTQKRKTGDLGEDIAEMFLVKHGFRVIERNYLRKWGEIDIILKKGKKLHFVEVKTVSRENTKSVSHETDGYRPEDNLHGRKLKRLGRAIQSYLYDQDLEKIEWQLDAVVVYLDVKKREAKVKVIDNIII